MAKLDVSIINATTATITPVGGYAQIYVLLNATATNSFVRTTSFRHLAHVPSDVHVFTMFYGCNVLQTREISMTYLHYFSLAETNTRAIIASDHAQV